MPYSISTRQAKDVAGLDPTIYDMTDAAGTLAEVWPALGFNCITWRTVRDGRVFDLLYSDPALFQGARPTRSGIPVLFPFPNRIRDGRFTFAGQQYQLPLNDPVQKNAIHGFACRSPWRVVDQGTDENSAWLTGEFRCSVDAPASLAHWPADHQIRLTIRLSQNTLRLEALITNPDTKPLPWGLGYHPYFRVPFVEIARDLECFVEAPAKEYWVLDGNLPTGERRTVDDTRDLNSPRRFADLSLDDVLTTLPARKPRADGLVELGSITGAPGEPMRVFCSDSFRHVVVFTPPHRQAFCIEPYTCTTDAINLGDPGWGVLPPGASTTLVVELRV